MQKVAKYNEVYNCKALERKSNLLSHRDSLLIWHNKYEDFFSVNGSLIKIKIKCLNLTGLTYLRKEIF